MELLKRICCAAAMMAVIATALPAYAALPGMDGIVKDTFVFSVADGDTLRLDRYTDPSLTPEAPRPALIYAFGGGFRGGDRSSDYYMPMFATLVREGYMVISTDYRTTLAGIDPSALSTAEGFAGALSHAIATATADFYDATAYVIAHAEAWDVDPARIVACGSSAGAITVMQAELGICNSIPAAHVLPEGFNYAAVISMAGAVCSDGEPVWTSEPCPLMMFHGDADSIVPFDHATSGTMGLWGSAYIHRQLADREAPCYFYIARGAGHEMAGEPMQHNLEEILAFLRRMALPGSKPASMTTEWRPLPTKPYRTDFTLEDYIRANTGQ